MEFQKQKAIYLQISDYICEQILLDAWKVNDKILSVRELAIHMEVNPNTVARAYSYLEEKHIIFTQRGVGYFVSESAKKNILKLKKEEFLNQDLPMVFKNMELLNIKMADLKKLYQQYKMN